MIRTLFFLTVSLILSALAGGPACAATAAGIRVLPATLAFPVIGVGAHSGVKVVTFRNAGTKAVTAVSVGLVGAGAGSYSTTQTCGTTLAAGARCTVSVTFDPKSCGGQAANLRLVASGASVASVPVAGLCTDPTLVPPDANTYVFNTTQGDIYIELRPDAAPKNVANFLYYVGNGTYSHSIIHRVVAGFVNQGGGYKLNAAGKVIETKTAAPVVDEYKLSNLRGTIAFAKTSAPNSATDQFFFNTADNPNLNTQNGGFTVFGQIVGVQGISGVSQAASLAVMDTMNADPVYDGGSPFDSLPLLNYTAGAPVKPANFVYVNSVTHVKPKAGIPATPIFSIGSGTYKGPQTVTLTDATPNAKIYYYLFQAASRIPVQYTGPFTVSKSQRAVAYAVAPGYPRTSYSNYEAFSITAQ